MVPVVVVVGSPNLPTRIFRTGPYCVSEVNVHFASTNLSSLNVKLSQTIGAPSMPLNGPPLRGPHFRNGMTVSRS